MSDPLRSKQKLSPCYGCPDREPACSGRCQKPEYLKYRAEQERIKAAKKNIPSSSLDVAGGIQKRLRPRSKRPVTPEPSGNRRHPKRVDVTLSKRGAAVVQRGKPRIGTPERAMRA